MLKLNSKDNSLFHLLKILFKIKIDYTYEAITRNEFTVDIIDNLSPNIQLLSQQFDDKNINIMIEQEDFDELYKDYLIFLGLHLNLLLGFFFIRTLHQIIFSEIEINKLDYFSSD